MNIYTTWCSLNYCKDFLLLLLLLLWGSRSTKSLIYDVKHFQNATVIVKYSWGVFRALSQMIALSYGSMDAPTSENYRFSFSITKKSTGVSNSPLSYKYLTFHTKQGHVLVSLSPDYVEMWIVMVSMVSGCLMYTVLVANATTMIANIDPAAKEYKSKVIITDTFIHQNTQLITDQVTLLSGTEISHELTLVLQQDLCYFYVFQFCNPSAIVWL